MEAKDNKRTLNCAGKLLVLDEPLVLGVLNLTPDSFFDGGKYRSEAEIISRTETMIEEGADIIDIGAFSTRPGAKHISENEELKRIIPSVKLISNAFPDIVISIDTFRSNVASASVDNGASIINDISGGQFDNAMFETVARLNTPYILTHIKGEPRNMQINPKYDDVVQEVTDYFIKKTKKLRECGVTDIIIDPGFGFGKTVAHNYQLLARLKEFNTLELPILAGISRKSMINKVLGTTPNTALGGTIAANTIALMNGASMLRVHDVKQAKEAIKIVNYTLSHLK
jgi:dihydropteroate synthase